MGRSARWHVLVGKQLSYPFGRTCHPVNLAFVTRATANAGRWPSRTSQILATLVGTKARRVAAWPARSEHAPWPLLAKQIQTASTFRALRTLRVSPSQLGDPIHRIDRRSSCGPGLLFNHASELGRQNPISSREDMPSRAVRSSVWPTRTACRVSRETGPSTVH